MGDLIDSIFQRQCSLTDSKDRDRSGQQDATDVTILEVGAQKTVGSDTYQCRSFNDLRDYFDRKNKRNEEDLFWDEPIRTRPSYLRLFFLPPLNDGQTSMAAPRASGPLGFTEILHEKVGLNPMFMDDYSEADEDPVSPTSSPRRSALATRSRRARFALDGLDEDAVMTLQPQKEQIEPSQTWVWDTRYTHSTTQTLADPDTTTYLCINYPQRLQSRILDTIQGLEALAKNPLFLDTLIIDEMIAFYRDAIKVHRTQLLAIQNDDEPASTELAIRLEELAGNWRTILQDIRSIQTHIQRLRAVAEAKKTHRRRRSGTPPPTTTYPFPRGDFLPRHHSHRGHTRQQSSDVFGPPASEVLQLQDSTCEFWARCVTMYQERTADRLGRAPATSTSTYTLRKTIPLLRRRGSLPQLNRRLSNFTVEVAVQIQRNSSSVSTLAVSLFSTIFFSPDGLLFAITYWWWILATLVVPLTLIVLHLGVDTLARNTPFVRRRKAQRLAGVAEDERDEETLSSRADGE
ncbi:hypothetical protein VSDG_05898 [Cytospora chrysosperma]|uniref:Uncharacterized protein n=1 Tax=Cytospora chrysosperma TaxID=252740 RepID=A0A423VTV8_CYTCH|nr:hypothetical protein VSDG_05898 [Valsa sordida]